MAMFGLIRLLMLLGVAAEVMIIDNPVGSGFSYLESFCDVDGLETLCIFSHHTRHLSFFERSF